MVVTYHYDQEQSVSYLNLEYWNFLCLPLSDSVMISWLLKEGKFKRGSHGEIRRKGWFGALQTLCFLHKRQSTLTLPVLLSIVEAPTSLASVVRGV